MLHQNSIVPSKAHHHLTDRQIKYLSARVQGKTKAEAKAIAGFSPNCSPTQIEKSSHLKNSLRLALDQVGLTEDVIARKIKEGFSKTKMNFFTHQGKVISEKEVDDNETQVKYVRTALEIRGDLQEKNIEINMGLIAIPGNVKDPNQWNQEDVSTQNP